MVFGAEYRIVNSRCINISLSSNGIQKFSIPSAHIPKQNNDPTNYQDSGLVLGSRYKGIMNKFIKQKNGEYA